MIKTSRIQKIQYPSGEISAKKDSIVECVQKNGIFMINNPDPESIFVSLSAINEFENPVKAIIAYIPTARADKPGNFDIKTMSKIFSTGNFSKVFVLDPHSKKSETIFVEELNKAGILVETIYPVDVIKKLGDIVSGESYDAVIAPDSGAKERALKVSEYLGIPLVTCEKKRNQETGKILYHSIDNSLSTNIEKVLVVDDICDGGYTFKLLRDSLPDNVVSDLYVSHGIFSGRANENLSGYRKIITTDSLEKSPTFDYRNTTTVELSEFLWKN